MKTSVLSYIPYTGNIEVGISAARAKELAAVETNEVLGDFNRKLSKIEDAGIEYDNAMPAVAGGVILSSKNPQHVYDAVFGVEGPQRTAKVISFAVAQEERKASALNTAFGDAVHPARASFRDAVANVANRHFAPSIDAAVEFRAA